MKPSLKALVILLAFLAVPLPGLPQDQPINERGPALDLTDRSNSPQWSAANRVYIFTPLNPDQSMCLWISNNNPTNSHTFTLNVFQTGDRRVNDFTNNQGRWTSDTVVGSPSPVAALSSSSVFVHSNAAVKVAVQITGAASAAGSPDTMDMYLVQTNATSCGPAASGTNTEAPATVPAGRPANTFPVSPAGATFSDLARTVTANTQVELTTSVGELVNFNVCSVTLAVTGTVSGTTPTLNVRIQVSADGTTWDDRISFAQVTATGNFQEASISSGSLNVTTYAQNTLAAGSIVDGTFPGRMRINYTVGGTTPSFGGTNVRAVCK